MHLRKTEEAKDAYILQRISETELYGRTKKKEMLGEQNNRSILCQKWNKSSGFLKRHSIFKEMCFEVQESFGYLY